MHHFIQHRPLSITQLFSCRKGASMPLVALAGTVILGTAGLAIDMGRAQMVHSKLVTALDAAGLATGSVVSTVDPTAYATKYMNANYPSGYLGSTLNSVTVTVNNDNTVLTLTANATVETTLMRVMGFETIPVSAETEITRANRGLELALVLDITGSMWSSGKIASLRAAAVDLVDVLYGNRETIDNLWVGVVPYVTAVNIGNNHTSWTDYDSSLYPSGLPTYAPSNLKWKGCVEARPAPYDLDDTPPDVSDSDSIFPIFFWPDTDEDKDNNWVDDDDGSITVYETVNYSNSGGLGPNISCGEEILPLTASKTTITDKINGLYPWRRGGTMSHVGLVWGWRLISPNWRGLGWGHDLVGGADTLPLDYDAALMDKVIVLMTDGENQFYDTQSADPFYSDYTAYKRLDDLRSDINTTNQNTARDKINTKLSTICENIKNEGITIYTVTFKLGSSGNHNEIRDLFRSCASKPAYYFDADSTAGGSTVTLSTAFKTIGDALANLRISK